MDGDSCASAAVKKITFKSGSDNEEEEEEEEEVVCDSTIKSELCEVEVRAEESSVGSKSFASFPLNSLKKGLLSFISLHCLYLALYSLNSVSSLWLSIDDVI